MPRVSVLMTAHRAGPFFQAAVRSVLEQEFRDLELMVVDDGSPAAEVSQALEAFGDPRLRSLRLDTSRGTYAAALLGARACSGSVVVRHDSDDTSVPGRVGVLVAALDASPDVDALGSLAQFVDPQGTITGGYVGPCSAEAVAQVARTRMPLCHPTLAIRARVLEDVPYRPQFHTAGDYDLVSRLVERHRVAVLPLSLYRYRLHGASMTQTRGLLQEACGATVVLMGARRRSGRPERLEESLELAAQVAASHPDRPSVRLRFAALLRTEGYWPEAAVLARTSAVERGTLGAHLEVAAATLQGMAARPATIGAALRNALGAATRAVTHPSPQD